MSQGAGNAPPVAPAPADGDGFSGLGALRRLARLRFRAWAREHRRGLKRPRRKLLWIVGLGLVALMVFVQGRDQDEPQTLSQGDLPAAFLTVFVLSTVLAAVGSGSLVFSPAEVHFLFPGPVGSRALIASHLISASVKSLTGALTFAVFFPTGDSGLPRRAGAYTLLFVTLVLLGVWVDLLHMHLDPADRRRRAWRWTAATLLLLGAGFLATAAADGAITRQAVRHLVLPGALFAGLLTAPADQALGHLAGTLALAGLLTAACLTWRGDIRPGALANSERFQRFMERVGKQGLFVEGTEARTSGRVLPMLPRWGGAGCHAWRQLSSLRRKRKALTMLILFPALMGGFLGFVKDGAQPEAGAAAMIAMLAFVGPMYVQCDFRADHGTLAWLRSLPTSATALALGQLMASSAVVTALQWLMGGWGVFFAAPEQRLLWLVALAGLPALNVVLLAVENGAWLLKPYQLDFRRGPPGALEVLRLYGLMLAKFVALGVVLGLGALPATLVTWLTGSPLAGALLGLATLVAEAVLLVGIVGRLFRAVDVGEELAQD